MTFKTAASSVGNGLLIGLGALAAASHITRIAEIDAEMAPLQARLDELQKERDHHEAWL